MNRRAFPSMVLVLGLAGLGGRAGAATELEDEMASLAAQIKEYVASEGNQIEIGAFDGPDNLKATGGSEIARAIEAALGKLEVAVTPSAKCQLRGEYFPVEDAASGRPALAIKAKLVGKGDKTLINFKSRGIFNITEMSGTLGLSVALDPADPPDKRDQVLAKALEHPEPPALVASTPRIAAGPSSPYAIEMLIGPDPGNNPPDVKTYTARAAEINGRHAFVPIDRGEVYAVKIHNTSPHDAAATITIDGLNMFTFSENKNYKVVIVPAGKTAVVPGWHRTNARSGAFRVNGYEASAAARVGINPDAAEIGSLTVVFAAAWTKGSPPPEDERPGGLFARPPDATEVGPEIAVKYQEVTRDVGRMRESVSVRYSRP